jgi:hypothetical protein
MNDEERALLELEQKIKALPKGPAKDERFWTDFVRNVRVDTDRRSSSARRWWVLLAPSAAALAAAWIALGPIAPLHLETAPASILPLDATDSTEVSSDDEDLEDIVDQMSSAELARVEKTLEGQP